MGVPRKTVPIFVPIYTDMLDRIDEIKGMGLHLDMVLRKIQRAYLRAFEALGLEVTIEQWVLLHQIYEMGEGAAQNDIVKGNFRNRATISRVIGGLERRGWIQKKRFDGDQKRFRLQLTPQGREIIQRSLPTALALRKLAIKNVDPQEFESFLKVLDQIGENYEGT